MLIRIRKGWEIPDSQATPETVFLNRRRLLKTAAAGSVMLGAGGLLAACDDDPAQAAAGGDSETASAAEGGDPSAKLYPAPRNETYTLDRPITDEGLATTYNNYYEFGSSKNIWQKAQALPVRPWTVTLDGMVEQPMEIGIDDLLAKMPLEERVYRHRCVEAWSMAVPYSGFAMKALVDLARPLSSAKYVKMTTFENPDVAGGQRAAWYPWPYIEGLTMAEARHDLAFIATGLYGKPIPKQNGAPLRLAVPWKYGFKHIKGIVRFEFTDQRPKSFWEAIQSSEYGFWANVNPEVPHPRWSQASERVLGLNEQVPTLLYNGYGEYVADLYKGIDPQQEALFM
ncbi:protein-methionine-sulfoxide reductase catalytic subunit MsrP [Pelagibius sp. 7325]|uniref:protein-methionine-sulfoxide reductase catalytic subunit MsrP n=1 Tax=Pelagibius sp. 7325 TaxID=3131994 RepID=UPI0030EE021C